VAVRTGKEIPVPHFLVSQIIINYCYYNWPHGWCLESINKKFKQYRYCVKSNKSDFKIKSFKGQVD
jgi:hypothetical protein